MAESNLKFGVGIVLLALFVVCGVGYSRASQQENQRFAQEYRQAPNCTQSSDPAGSAPACSYEAVQVVSKKADSHKSGWTYLVTLQGQSGRTKQVQVFEALYQTIAPGTALTTQVWRGEIRSLHCPDTWYKTGQNPEMRVHGSDLGLYATLYIAGAAVLCLCISWHTRWKALRSGAALTAPAGSEYPLVRGDG